MANILKNEYNSILITTSFLVLTSCFISCKTTKLGLEPECKEIEKLIVEFASKIEPQGDSCVVFRFDTDTLKYIKYKFRNGQVFVSNYKQLENFYWLDRLTEELKPMSVFDKNCISSISKDKIIKLFGNNYIYDAYSNLIVYKICETEMISGIYVYLNENNKVKFLLIYLV